MSDWEVVADNEKPNQVASQSEWEDVTPTAQNKNAQMLPLIGAMLSGNLFDPEHHLTRSIGQMIAGSLVPLGQDVNQLVREGAKTAVEGAPGAVYQIATNPKRAGKNLLAGGAELGRGIANIPHDLPTLMAHLNMISPQSGEKVSSMIPAIPEIKENLDQFVGGNQTAADKLLRGMIANAPVTFPIARLAGVAGKAAVMAPIKGVGKTISDVQKLKSLGGLQEAQKGAAENLANIEGEQQQAQSAANIELGSSNLDTLQRKVNQHTEKLNALDEQLQSAPKIEPANLDEAETNLNQAENNHEQAKQLVSNIDTDIGKHLNEGAAHDVRAAASVDKRVQSIEDYWSDAYKDFEQQVRDAHFEMPKSAMENLDYANVDPSKLIQTYGADAFEAIKKGKMEDFVKKMQEKEEPQNPYYKKLLDVAPTTEDTSAADFLLKRRAFRDALYDLKQKIYNDKFSVLEEDAARKAAKQGDQMMSQIDKTLSEGLGEYKPEFDRINKGYSEQVYPLRNNSFVKAAKEGSLPSNMIRALRTNEEGMPLVREIVKQDPELLKNVVGQRYEAKPGELHYPDELTQEYLNEMPNLQNLLNVREGAVNKVNEAKANLEQSKLAHKETKTKQAQVEKESEKQKNMMSERESIQKEIDKANKHINNLQEISARKNLSLKQKMKAENDLKEAKEARKRLIRKAAIAGTAIIGYKGYQGISSLLQ